MAEYGGFLLAKYAYHQKDRNQDALVAWLTARGCTYEHIGKPVDGLCAIPSGRGYVTVSVEFKQPRAKLRASQEAFIARWPGKVYVLRTEVDCAWMLSEESR